MLFTLTILLFFMVYQEATSQCNFYGFYDDRQSNNREIGTCLQSETFDKEKYAPFSSPNSCYLYKKMELNKLFIKKPHGTNVIYLRDCNGSFPIISYLGYIPYENTYEEIAVNKSVSLKLFQDNPQCAKDCYNEGCKILESSDSAIKEVEKCLLYEEFTDMFDSNKKHQTLSICIPEEKNVIYTEWSRCSTSCTQFKEKQASSETNDGCKITTMPEKMYRTCNDGDCSFPNAP